MSLLSQNKKKPAGGKGLGAALSKSLDGYDDEDIGPGLVTGKRHQQQLNRFLSSKSGRDNSKYDWMIIWWF